MRSPRTLPSIALVLVAACGGQVSASSAPDTGPSPAPDAATLVTPEFPPGVTPDAATVVVPDAPAGATGYVVLAYDGSSAIVPDAETGVARVAISAPIFPHTFKAGGGLDLYGYEGANYPTTYAGELQLARGAGVTYASLLAQCAALHSTIVLQAAGSPPLPASVLASNLEAVARCAYEDFGIKPYWIPQLVDDVDLCGELLGAGWKLPTEADLAALTDAERATWQQAASAELFGSLNVYVRANDGSLKLAGLGVGSRALEPFLAFGGAYNPKNHYEGGVNLRCFHAATP
jgi:hypothetical protein